MISFFLFRLSISTERWEEVALFFCSKKSQAEINRFHIASEYFFATGPIVFHSFCSLVVRQRLLSSRCYLSGASAFYKEHVSYPVCIHALFQGFKEFTFLAEEFITRFTETFEYLPHSSLRCKTDGLPLVLQGNDLPVFYCPTQQKLVNSL